MKKDYIPALKNYSTLSEIDRIEQYWTRIWDCDHLDTKNFADTIEKREEFKVISPFLSDIPPNSRILDGGCGMGEWTIYFAKKGFHIFGLDISKKTIQKLKQRFNDINFCVGDIRHTEFENGYFDAYFSWGAFEHFENGLEAPLTEARRIIKQGGYLFLSIPFQNVRHLLRDNRELWRWDENYDKKLGYQSDIQFYQWRHTKSELKRELERNGFRTIKIEAIHKEHGVLGAIRYDLHTEPSSKVGRIMQLLLKHLIPKNCIAHMIVGVAQKV